MFFVVFFQIHQKSLFWLHYTDPYSGFITGILILFPLQGSLIWLHYRDPHSGSIAGIHPYSGPITGILILFPLQGSLFWIHYRDPLSGSIAGMIIRAPLQGSLFWRHWTTKPVRTTWVGPVQDSRILQHHVKFVVPSRFWVSPGSM